MNQLAVAIRSLDDKVIYHVLTAFKQVVESLSLRPPKLAGGRSAWQRKGVIRNLKR